MSIMSAGNSVFSFIAGAIAGAVAAILFAPDSGERTRAKIRRGISDATGRARRKIEEGLDSIEESMEEM